MTLRFNQNGSHLIAVGLAIIVLGVVGLTGYRVMNHRPAVNDAASPAATVKAPAQITTKADLSQASQSLNDSGTDINNSMNSGSLNNDLNDLL